MSSAFPLANVYRRLFAMVIMDNAPAKMMGAIVSLLRLST
jgi:hypothetical protein